MVLLGDTFVGACRVGAHVVRERRRAGRQGFALRGSRTSCAPTGGGLLVTDQLLRQVFFVGGATRGGGGRRRRIVECLRDGAFGGRADQPRVLRPHAARHLRRRRAPGFATRGEVGIGAQLTRRCVDEDRVAFAQQADRSTPSGL